MGVSATVSWLTDRELSLSLLYSSCLWTWILFQLQNSPLRDNNCFNLVVRQSFMEAEHKGQLKNKVRALRVPCSATDIVLPHAFSPNMDGGQACPGLQVATGIRIIGEAAWRSCLQLQVVHLPSTVVILQNGVFRRSHALRTVLAPGCKQFGIKVFEECCSLLQLGTTSDSTNQLAPRAQFRPRAFEKCTALRHLNFEQTEYDPTDLYRCLPECCFLEAGLVSLSLPPDFNWIGPAACERCLQLQSVDLSRTNVTEILGCTFAHCLRLQQLSLSSKLRRIEQEAFAKCTALEEVRIPPTLLYIARRAFAGCTQLRIFQKTGKSTTWRGTYARANAFENCQQLDTPRWIRFLPANAKDRWVDEFLTEMRRGIEMLS